jgi:hypothetical protein
MTSPIPESIIGPKHPPRDGRRWQGRCARCGSSLEWMNCETCDGNGCIERDPWENDIEDCPDCAGRGSWQECAAERDWCLAHPLPGREQTTTGTLEWICVGEEPKTKHQP